MPYVEPTAASADLQSTVTFLAQSHVDLWTRVNFCSALFNSYSLPSSATFGYSKDLFSSIYFWGQGSINSSVTFATSGTFNLDSYVDFTLLSYSLPSSATFTGTGSQITSNVTFFTSATLPSSATFYFSESIDLSSIVNFGVYNANIYGFTTFLQSLFNKFLFQIVIQNNVEPHNVNFDEEFIFPLNIFIIQNVANVLPSFVNFYHIQPTADLYSSVQFEQERFMTFPLEINIDNVFSGIDNIQILTILNPNDPLGGSASHDIPKALEMKGTPPVGFNYVTLPVYTDEFGYFEVNNLLPGNYVIFPYKQGLAFNPTYIPVTITNQNVTIYFYSTGQLDTILDNPDTNPIFPEPPPGSCFIDQGNGLVATFSIDGYVLPAAILPGETSMFVVATDDEAASDFRQTLDNG